MTDTLQDGASGETAPERGGVSSDDSGRRAHVSRLPSSSLMQLVRPYPCARLSVVHVPENSLEFAGLSAKLATQSGRQLSTRLDREVFVGQDRVVILSSASDRPSLIERSPSRTDSGLLIGFGGAHDRRADSVLETHESVLNSFFGSTSGDGSSAPTSTPFAQSTGQSTQGKCLLPITYNCQLLVAPSHGNSLLRKVRGSGDVGDAFDDAEGECEFVAMEEISVKAGSESEVSELLLSHLGQGQEPSSSDAGVAAESDGRRSTDLTNSQSRIVPSFIDDMNAEFSSSFPTARRATSSNSSKSSLLHLACYQDVSKTQRFFVLYYTRDGESFAQIRASKAWKSWRRRLAIFLHDLPKIHAFAPLASTKFAGAAPESSSFSESRGRASSQTQNGLRTASGYSVSGASTVPLSNVPSDPAIVAENATHCDSRLDRFGDQIRRRYEHFLELLDRLGLGLRESPNSPTDMSVPLTAGKEGDSEARGEVKLSEEMIAYLTCDHKRFGALLPSPNSSAVVFREWLPSENIVGLHLVGDFNAWDQSSHPFKVVGENLYELEVPIAELFGTVREDSVREDSLCKYKLLLTMADGSTAMRLSPFTRRSTTAFDSTIVDGVLSLDDLKADALADTRSDLERYTDTVLADTVRADSVRADSVPMIYECHVGSCTGEERIGSFEDVRKTVLPHMKAFGFNTLCLVGIQEHYHYPSVGFHLTLPFAVCHRFGTPADLTRLVDEAHSRYGFKVLLSTTHAHASPAKDSGIARFDNTEAGLYFREGSPHKDHGGVLYDLSKPQTIRYLLSLTRYFVDRYKIDGFRFEHLGSMLYHDLGLNGGFDRYNYEHFFTNMDLTNHSYLMLLTTVFKSIYSSFNSKSYSACPLMIANDYFGTPTVALSVRDGGLGFDFVMCQHLAPVLRDFVKTSAKAASDPEAIDRCFSLESLRYQLDRRSCEKRVALCETLESTTIARRPMRIAFFAWETLHTIAVGGIAPHVTELAAALRRVGQEVHIFTRATGASPALSDQYGVCYHEVPFRLDTDFVKECANMCNAFVDALLAWEHRTNTHFDQIHGHDWLVAKAVVRCKDMGRLVVFTMHSTEAGRCGNKVFGGNSSRVRDIEREGCHRADRVICVSGVLADEVKRFYGVPSEKIRVIYNGCNAENFDGFEDAAAIKQRYGVGAMDPTFLFVGRFVVQKGVDLLVEAAPKILQKRGDVKFVIVGDGHMRSDVERRAAQLSVSHAFRFVGAKTGAELKSIFKMCDAVVVPSRNEPFGIVVLEAWSAYKPVIATTCGGPRDFVSPNVDGILVDPEPSSIAWGCCEALSNFDHLRWMGERGRVKAAYSFSWDTIGQQTRDVYYELSNRLDCSFGFHAEGDCSLAERAIGSEALLHKMGIFADDARVTNGFSVLKIAHFLAFTLGGDGFQMLQGSEFAHPNYLDLPRCNNNFSHAFAKRQMRLCRDKALKFKHYAFFTKQLLTLLDAQRICYPNNDTFVNAVDEHNKIIVFQRAHCLHVANLHPSRSHSSYDLHFTFITGSQTKSESESDSNSDFQSREPTHLRMLLDTDQAAYGGWGRIDASQKLFKVERNPEGTSEQRNIYKINIYLPSQCALVFGVDAASGIGGIGGDSEASTRPSTPTTGALTLSDGSERPGTVCADPDAFCDMLDASCSA